MKVFKTAIFLALAITLIASMVVAPSYAKTHKGLVLYWRGETPCGAGFKEGLKSLGVDIEIVEFNCEKDKTKLKEYLSSINENDFDFAYSFGTTVSVAAANAIKNKPLFFGIVTNPVKVGLIKSWENSENNVTGVSHSIPYTDQVDFLLSIGDLGTVGIIYNPEEKNAVIAKNELEALLSKKGVSLIAASASEDSQLEKAISELLAAKPDLVYLPSDSFVLSNADKIVPALNAAKIPTYGALKKYIDKHGAMIGIVSSYHQVGQELSNSASEVLNGKKPSQVPSKTLPMDLQTIMVNATTAEQLGYKIPYEILSVAKVAE